MNFITKSFIIKSKNIFNLLQKRQKFVFFSTNITKSMCTLTIKNQNSNENDKAKDEEENLQIEKINENKTNLEKFEKQALSIIL